MQIVKIFSPVGKILIENFELLLNKLSGMAGRAFHPAGDLVFANKNHKHEDLLKKGDVAEATKYLNGTNNFSLKQHTHDDYIERNNEKQVMIEDVETLQNVPNIFVSKDHKHQEFVARSLHSIAYSANYLYWQDESQFPNGLFAKFHHEHPEFLPLNMPSKYAKKINGNLPSQLADAEHIHQEYLTSVDAKLLYKPKTSVALSTARVNNKQLKIIYGSSKGSGGSLTQIAPNVKLDLWKMSGITELPTSLTSFGQTLNQSDPPSSLNAAISSVTFYLDISTALTSSQALPVQVKLSAINSPLLQLAGNLLNITMSANLFTATFFKQHPLNIVDKQTVEVSASNDKKVVSDVFLTIGGKDTNFANFDKYTSAIDAKLRDIQTQTYRITRKFKDVWQHVRTGIYGIAGNKIVVQNRGFPYTLVVFERPLEVSGEQSVFFDLPSVGSTYSARLN